MFSRIATLFIVLFFVLSASASTVSRTNNPSPSDQCTIGTVQCCNSTFDAGDPVVNIIAGHLDIVLAPITGPVGIACNPINISGGGVDSCSFETVCCTGNNIHNGAIIVGCTLININA